MDQSVPCMGMLLKWKPHGPNYRHLRTFISGNANLVSLYIIFKIFLAISASLFFKYLRTTWHIPKRGERERSLAGMLIRTGQNDTFLQWELTSSWHSENPESHVSIYSHPLLCQSVNFCDLPHMESDMLPAILFLSVSYLFYSQANDPTHRHPREDVHTSNATSKAASLLRAWQEGFPIPQMSNKWINIWSPKPLRPCRVRFTSLCSVHGFLMPSANMILKNKNTQACNHKMPSDSSAIREHVPPFSTLCSRWMHWQGPSRLKSF